MSYFPPTATPLLTAFERFLARNPALLALELQEAREQRQTHGLTTFLVLLNTGEYDLVREVGASDPPSPTEASGACTPLQEMRLQFPDPSVVAVDGLVQALMLQFFTQMEGHFSNIWKRRYLQQTSENQPGS